MTIEITARSIIHRPSTDANVLIYSHEPSWQQAGTLRDFYWIVIIVGTK